MIRLYPEDLPAHLQQGLNHCYLLSGNEPLLLHECNDVIRQAATEQGFQEIYYYSLDNNTDWAEIFSQCQSMSLFASRQIISLQVPDNGPTSTISTELLKLFSLLHPDLLLLLRCPKLTKAQENSAWFKALDQHNTVYLRCLTPERQQLSYWVKKRAKKHALQLDDASTELLCYCYEGNLLALSQALERLALIHPDGHLTLQKVEQAVNDAAHFTPYHWLDSLLDGKRRRARHILKQLQAEGCEPLLLIRTLQKELLLLLRLQRSIAHSPLRILFDQHKVWQNRRPLLTNALKRLPSQQLGQALHLLARLELILKQDFNQSVWDKLDILSMLLCGTSLPESMLEV